MSGSRRRPRPPIVAAVLIAASLCATACGDGPTTPAPPGALDLALPWTTAAPAEVGMDEQTLIRGREAGALIERMRGLVVVRGGKLVVEQYYRGWTADTLADVRSVTKSLVSTLAGIALERRDIAGLDDPITDYLHAPEYPMRAEHAAVTVRHLLTMTGGFDWDEDLSGDVNPYAQWIQSGDHVAYLLARDLRDVPGSTFTYNSAAVHLLGVLVAEAVGRPLDAFADEALFQPLGIERRVWEQLSGGHANGGAGIDLALTDLAKVGQLFLQGGYSGARALVPELWIEEATTRRFAWTTSAGSAARISYGYLWWLDLDRRAWFGWGHGGQFLYIAPELDLVVVAATEWRGASADGTYRATEEAVLGLIVDYVVAAAG